MAAIMAAHARTNAPRGMVPSMRPRVMSPAMRADHHQPATASSSRPAGTPSVSSAPSPAARRDPTLSAAILMGYPRDSPSPPASHDPPSVTNSVATPAGGGINGQSDLPPKRRLRGLGFHGGRAALFRGPN